jgi:oligopeptidase B
LQVATVPATHLEILMSLRRLVAVLGLFASCPALAAQTAPPAPAVRQVEHISVWHGEQVNDPFFWLREKSNPEVIKYLEAENAYTDAMTKDLKPFADALYQEMVGHIKQTDLSVPVRQGAYFYYEREQEGKQYPIHCRKRAAEDGSFSETATEEILLDSNQLAEGSKFFSLDAFEVSDDANLLAYSTDITGFRQHRLYIKDLRTGRLLPDSSERVTSVAWCADNRTLFYTTEDPITKRSNTVWRHPLGDETEPVYQEKDRLYTVELARSTDKKMLFLRCDSVNSLETRFLRSDQPGGSFEVVLPREQGHKYRLDHRDGLFYIRTNRGAKNFRLVTAPVSAPSPPNWKELLPHRANVLLESVELFQDHLVASEKSAALEQFRVLDFRSGEWHEVGFPERAYTASAAHTHEYTARSFRFRYESLVTPERVYDYDMATRQKTLRKAQEVPGYDPALYTTERHWAVARDGVKVPLSIVYKRGVKKDGSAPLYLYGYGSYGSGLQAAFDSNGLSFLDRGMVYVLAHIRGGDEMGEAWHDDGMLLKKKNTFHDFIDSAEWLFANGWTSKDRLLIEGISAGGLLVGVVANLRPDLFKAVHVGVPFVDVMNTMMDASVPLTFVEYLEWGNPGSLAAFDYMRSYSPYDNLERKAYPAMLVTTSLNDSQVMYWEPAKYVAKLRTLKTDSNPLLLKCNMGAGHGGASGRYDRLKETAFEYAWLMSQVGIRK